MWSSGSLGADTAAPVEHYRASASQEQIQVFQWSIIEQQLPRSTHSSSAGACRAAALYRADAGAPLEHMEQQLPGSTESNSAGVHGEEVLWEQIQVLQWSIMEQQLPWNTDSSCIGAHRAAALWDQIQVLQWSII